VGRDVEFPSDGDNYTAHDGEARAGSVFGSGVGLAVFWMSMIADSDDAAHRFRHEAARRSDLMPPILGRSVGG